MKEIDIGYLKCILDYCPSTGVFTWKKRAREEFSSQRAHSTFNAKFAGKQCGSLTNKYLTIRINNSLYYSHRLAWAMHYGEWPVGDVDHINMDKTDNRISNLRLARRRDNMNNLTATKSNKSGFIGVYWAKRERKWVSGITIDYKFHHLGYFDDPVSAASAYNAACEKANGRFSKEKIKHNLKKMYLFQCIGERCL
ncbi:HNH endonuclease [Klebsiella variicola]|uniref:HNH endonuclease n=1 Tax=Klebsiella variicola TaxID=244366 RepID=UPI002180ED57|nr:HNH endonuclease [Klebsiella variicola]GKK65532.1 hypothetical protein NUKP41_04650 [Klebsiella variicola]HCI9083782.1 HNH endonuclease [Klebsiella variicola]